MSDGQTNRLLLLGLDGLNWPLLEPLLAAGVMPCLAQLRRESAWGPLTSVVPTQSAAAWATFLTGQNPARHGIVDFAVRQPDGTYRHAKPHAASTFWHHLAQAGLRVGVVNFPVTYPPDPVPEGSFLVSGMLSPAGRTFTHPPALGAELLAAIPGYRLDVEWQLYVRRPQALLDDLQAMTRQRVQAARYLHDRYDPDCLAVAFVGPDRLLHALWADLDPAHPRHDADRAAALRPGIHAFFRTLDEAVGELVSVAGGAAVLVLSDHGFQAAARQFRVNDWLAGQGWLVRQPAKARLERWARRLDSPWVRRVRKRLVKDISRHLTTFAPGGTLDWARTAAFSPWNAQQGIRLNVRGREPQGAIEPGAAYEALRDEIRQALRAAVEPGTGQPVADRVWLREEIYAGPHFDSMPDLVFTLSPGFASSPMQPGLWDDTGWGTGDHSLEGIGLARGPGILPRYLEGACLVDVAPTALYLLGRPVPQEMDGRVWVHALDPVWLAARPVRRAAGGGPGFAAQKIASEALSPAEEAELRARLQGLGYL